jgi:hypothetical protein
MPSIVPVGFPSVKGRKRHRIALAEFLSEHASEWEIPRLSGRAIVHGHRHDEAIML